ncbi:MAG: hypothetical protein K0S45_1193 [Nitrospira sp.]|jgi:hypothetical protein|nr:hypothetical protein [Nitrospira sp.]
MAHGVCVKRSDVFPVDAPQPGDAGKKLGARMTQPVEPWSIWESGRAIRAWTGIIWTSRSRSADSGAKGGTTKIRSIEEQAVGTGDFDKADLTWVGVARVPHYRRDVHGGFDTGGIVIRESSSP